MFQTTNQIWPLLDADALRIHDSRDHTLIIFDWEDHHSASIWIWTARIQTVCFGCSWSWSQKALWNQLSLWILLDHWIYIYIHIWLYVYIYIVYVVGTCWYLVAWSCWYTIGIWLDAAEFLKMCVVKVVMSADYGMGWIFLKRSIIIDVRKFLYIQGGLPNQYISPIESSV